MATGECPNEQQEDSALGAYGAKKIVPVKSKEPEAPKGITEEESLALKDRAADVIRQLEDASGS